MSAPAAPQTNAPNGIVANPAAPQGVGQVLGAAPAGNHAAHARHQRSSESNDRQLPSRTFLFPVKSYPRVRVPEHVPYLARSFSESASSESSDGSRRRGKRGRRQKHRGRTIAGLSPLARRIAEAIADQAAVTALVTHLLEMRERTGPPAETRIEHTTLDDVFSVSSGSPAPC
jgi:hypothetical protein